MCPNTTATRTASAKPRVSDPLDQLVREELDRNFSHLRDYQNETVHSISFWARKTLQPLLIDIPTGAGKSHIIAGSSACLQAMALYQTGHRKKILVIAPSAELVEQDARKMLEAGYFASIFCAGAGSKDHSSDFIFASPQTLSRHIEKVLEYSFAGIYIDEAHGISPTIKNAVETLRSYNPNVRVVGLTATPYRLRQGYIYRSNLYRNGLELSDEYALDPYFSHLIYEVSPHRMIDEGYIVPPVFGTIEDRYDTSALKRNSNLDWTPESEHKVFESPTAIKISERLVKDIRKNMKGRTSCMIFCQNIQHAEIVLDILHRTKTGRKQAALITHKTPAAERADILDRFNRRKGIKYLVNVSTLTTGFDVAHVDLIALMRATKSASLFQQIIGRGLRLSPRTGKTHCLILDYANNLERFCKDGDPFSPSIQAARPGDGPDFPTVDVLCPTCGHNNRFQAIQLPPDTEVDEHGYLRSVDTGTAITTAAGEPIGAHRGTRCQGVEFTEDGQWKRCTHTWSAIECPSCGTLNSAHEPFCKSCTTILGSGMAAIRPRATTSAEAPYSERRGQVEELKVHVSRTRKQVSCLILDFRVRELPYLTEDEDGEVQLVEPDTSRFRVWISPHWNNPMAKQAWRSFVQHCTEGDTIQLPEDLARSSVTVRTPEFINYRVKPPRDDNERVTFHEVLGFE